MARHGKKITGTIFEIVSDTRPTFEKEIWVNVKSIWQQPPIVKMQSDVARIFLMVIRPLKTQR